MQFENMWRYTEKVGNWVMQASFTHYPLNLKKRSWVSRNLCVHYLITRKNGVSLIYCNLGVKDESCKMLKWRK